MAEQGVREALKQAFGTADPYKILGLERSADAKGVKKAYRRQALRWVRGAAPAGAVGGP